MRAHRGRGSSEDGGGKRECSPAGVVGGGMISDSRYLACVDIIGGVPAASSLHASSSMPAG